MFFGIFEPEKQKCIAQAVESDSQNVGFSDWMKPPGANSGFKYFGKLLYKSLPAVAYVLVQSGHDVETGSACFGKIETNGGGLIPKHLSFCLNIVA